MFVEHVNVTVTDLDRSVAFYQTLLDLGLRWDGVAIGESGSVRAAHVGNDRCYLALFEASRDGAAPEDYAGAGVNHIGFVVDEAYEAVRARALDLGATIHFEPGYEPGRRFYIRDPDGIELEFVSYAP